MHAYIHTYMLYIHTHTHIYIYIHMHIYMYVCMYVCTYVYIYRCQSSFVIIYTYAYIVDIFLSIYLPICLSMICLSTYCTYAGSRHPRPEALKTGPDVIGASIVRVLGFREFVTVV